MAQLIEHTGIINKIRGNHVEVLIEQQAACVGCHAYGSCTVANKSDKIIDVENTDAAYCVGDKVVLSGRHSIGLQAVLLAFVIPFVLILITLLVLQLFIAHELISGALALLVLIPYYGVLSLFNKKMKATFKFEIKKDTID